MDLASQVFMANCFDAHQIQSRTLFKSRLSMAAWGGVEAKARGHIRSWQQLSHSASR